MLARSALALALATGFVPGVALTQPRLTVSPADAPASAPFQVKVEGVPPGSRVRITADQISATGETWTASGTYVADARGYVDAATAPSLEGTYQGISPHGLICSALPIPPEEVAAYIAEFTVKPTQRSVINARLEGAPVTVKALVEGREVASATAWRGFAVGTKGEAVSESTVHGLYYPPAPGRPVGEPVVVLTGSGGGLFPTTPALLASQGHPVLAQALYNYPGTPDALFQIPIEWVRDGALWLARKAGTRRVAVMGISRGSEAAQLAAAHFPGAFSGVIAAVPGHLVGGALGPGTTPADSAWSIGGKPVPAIPAESIDFERIREEGRTPPGYRGSRAFMGQWTDRALESAYGLPHDRLEAPILVLAGDADDIWPSWVSAERIRSRLAAAGKAGLAEVHVFPDAGHALVFVGRGNALSSFGYSAQLGGFGSIGGLPSANCEASFAAFEVTLAFLRRIR